MNYISRAGFLGIVLVLSAFGPQLTAQGLPMLEKDHLLGAFAGVQKRSYYVAVELDGHLNLISLKKDGARMKSPSAEVRFFIEEQSTKNAEQWSSKRFKDEEISSDQEAKENPETVTFIATASNDARIKVNYYFKDKDIYFDAELLDQGKAKGELRYGFDIVMPRAYRYTKVTENDQLKASSKGDKLTFFFEKDKVKAKLHERMKDVIDEHKDVFDSPFLGMEYDLNWYKGTKTSIELRKEGPAKMLFEPHPKANSTVSYMGTVRVLPDPESTGKGPWAKVSITN